MPDNINTNDYWEQRFEENWEERGGRMQTQIFANMALDMMPEWLKQELSAGSNTFCDAGCGLGDSYDIFSKLFTNFEYHGFDFSSVAVEKAGEKFPKAQFKVNNLFDLDKSTKYDVVFCSNVLEHFDKPIEIAKNLLDITKKYLLIMVPFREATDEPEHVVRFTPHNIPLMLGDSYLVYASGAQCPQEWLYNGRQILLIYAKNGHKKSAHYLSDIMENVSSDREEVIESAINIAQYESELQKKRADELNTQFYNYRLEAENEAIIVANQHKAQLEGMEAELEGLKAELQQKGKEYTSLDLVYKDLYSHSSQQVAELERLRNSWSFRVGLIVVYPFRLLYRLLKKIARMAKYIISFDMSGLKFELVEPFARRLRPIRTRMQKKKVLESIEADFRGKTVLIQPPTLDWNMPLFQRPQQLAMAYSRQKDMVVVYLTPNFNENVLSGFKAKDDLWILNSGLYENLKPYLKSASKRILSISWTINKPYSDSLPDSHLIYEYIDELEIFMNYDEQMETEHAIMAQRADVTVCTATKLYEQVKDIAKNPLLSTNGGDYELFTQTRNTPMHPTMVAMHKKFDKVLGYYGALAKWFDYDTVKEIAHRKPEWGWALVGMDYDETLKASGVLEFPNVEYLGPQDYKTLPSFLTGFDIATIPFAINEITLSTSPVKLFEYMAGGKPILTSDLPECRKYESVLRYTSADEFIEQAEKLLSLPADDAYWLALEREAKENTWDAKVQEILENLIS